MERRTPPEELLGHPGGPALKLSLKCNQCGKSSNYEVDYAVVHPKRDECKADGWDGVLLSRIIECRKCGAVDDYTLSPSARLSLMGQTLRRLDDDDGSGGSRIVLGVSQLFDGTIVRRPSQGIAHLREVVEKSPKSAEAWRRLGNALERYGKSDDAAVAWRKAIENDPKELEATYSLATLAGDRGETTEAFTFLRKALRLLPEHKSQELQQKLQMADNLVRLLRDILEVTDEPLAMMAGWMGGKAKDHQIVNASTVDLRKLTDSGWDRLPEFLASPDLAAVDLTPELPEEEPTNLQHTLNRDSDEPPEVEMVTVAPAPATRAPRVGPNVLCPCGSGKKYKRCCGR